MNKSRSLIISIVICLLYLSILVGTQSDVVGTQSDGSESGLSFSGSFLVFLTQQRVTI
jgi:hypothetical protein